MLCTFCESLNFDAACSKRGATHHETWSDLCASAEAGCELCMKILGCGHDRGHQRASEAHAIDNGHEKIRCFYDNDNSWLFWAGHPYKLANRIRSIHVCTASGTFFVLVRLKKPVERFSAQHELHKHGTQGRLRRMTYTAYLQMIP